MDDKDVEELGSFFPDYSFEDALQSGVTPEAEGGSLDSIICAICLGKATDKVAVVECAHVFCRECISHWHKVSNQCPLCKSNFNKVLRIKDKGLDEYEVIELCDQSSSWSLPELVGAIDSMSGRLAPPTTAGVISSANRCISDFEAVRNRRLNRFRTIQNPSFWKRNSKELERVKPWLNREFRAITGISDSDSLQLAMLQEYFVQILKTVSIQSTTAIALLEKLFLRDAAELLVLEFAAFARSPYNVKTFDEKCPLVSRPPLPLIETREGIFSAGEKARSSRSIG